MAYQWPPDCLAHCWPVMGPCADTAGNPSVLRATPGSQTTGHCSLGSPSASRGLTFHSGTRSHTPPVAQRPQKALARNLLGLAKKATKTPEGWGERDLGYPETQHAAGTSCLGSGSEAWGGGSCSWKQLEAGHQRAEGQSCCSRFCSANDQALLLGSGQGEAFSSRTPSFGFLCTGRQRVAWLADWSFGLCPLQPGTPGAVGRFLRLSTRVRLHGPGVPFNSKALEKAPVLEPLCPRSSSGRWAWLEKRRRRRLGGSVRTGGGTSCSPTPKRILWPAVAGEVA